MHITPSYLPAWRYGGPIWSVHGLAKAQAALGHDVRVMTTSMDGPGDLDVPLGVPVLRDGVAVEYFPVGGWSRRLARRLFHAPALGRSLRDHIGDIDIVHTHSVFLSPTSVASREARRTGVPNVLSPRGMLWPDMVRARSSLPKRLWLAAFERRNVELAAAVHVTAQIEEDRLRELGLVPQRVITLANGVDDPSPWSREDIGEDVASAIDGARYILSLGRLHAKKNNAALIDALSALPSAKLIIAGNDDVGIAPLLAEQAARLGVGDRVRILPRQIAGADKEALLTGADLFVLPSLSENFGNTVLEAMIRGVPVVVSDQAGAAEVVLQSGGGVVCAPDADALAQSIGRIWNDAEFAAAAAAAGQSHVRRHYGWTAVAEAMVAHYRELIA